MLAGAEWFTDELAEIGSKDAAQQMRGIWIVEFAELDAISDMPQNRSVFDRICREHDIEHRLTKPKHSWTNGQVERMNRTIKEATVRRYHYETNQQLAEHLAAFLDAYNFAKRLKTVSVVLRPHLSMAG